MEYWVGALVGFGTTSRLSAIEDENGDGYIMPYTVMLPHPAKKTDGSAMVAFYENVEKKRRDVCTTMKPGKFMQRFFPDTPDEDVRRFATWFEQEYGKGPEVRYSDREEDFIHAIYNGPTESCMSSASLSIKGHVHPAAVYAYGDIRVAWLERDGKPTARALINKSTKEHSRIYGDRAKLGPALERDGYTAAVGALVGCRLFAIEDENGGGYIMPYVDAGIGPGGGSLHAKLHGGYWELTEEEGISTYCGYDYGGVTLRTSAEIYCSCDDCGDDIEDEGDAYYACDRNVCESCYDSNYVSDAVVGWPRTGGYRYDTIPREDATYVECTDTYVRSDFLAEYLDHEGLIELDNGEIESIYNAVMDVCTEAYIHVDESSEVGTDSYGGTIFTEERNVRMRNNSRPDWVLREFYVDLETRNVYWHESSEVEAYFDYMDDDSMEHGDCEYDMLRFDRYLAERAGVTPSEVVCLPPFHPIACVPGEPVRLAA